MRIPPNLRDFIPLESIKQVAQTIGNPNLTAAIKEAIEKVGLKDSVSSQSIQQAFQNAGRWVETIIEPWTRSAQATYFSPGVNATGELFHNRWTNTLVTNQATLLLGSLLSNFVDGSELSMKLKQSLCERTQAADAIVVSNPVTALWAVAYAIRNLYPQQAWILPRLDCVRIPRFGTSSPSSLRNILDDANVLVREIGSIQECTFDDFQTAFQSAPSNLLISSLNSLHSHEYRAYRQAAQKAQEGKDIFTVELLMDGILEPMNIPPSLATKIGEQWSKGVDLILTPTDGWIGLQEGCLLLTKFKDDRWDAIVKLIGGLGLEACAATRICLLDSMQDAATSEAWSRTPLGQIVSTSLDNLKNRAQRIAVQINGSPRVERVEATSRMCRLGSGIWSQRELESSVLRIEPKGMTPEQCAHWLAASPRPIWCHTCSDHIELVLRTINPDDDRYVVQRFCNELSDSEDRTESSS